MTAGGTTSFAFGSTSAEEMSAHVVVISGRLGTGDPRDTLSNTAYVVADTTIRAATITPPAHADLVAMHYCRSVTPTTTNPGGWTAAQHQEAATSASRTSTQVDVANAATGNVDSTAGAATTGKHAFIVPLKVQATPAITGIDVATGPAAGGTTVVITGTALYGATAVKFGATDAASFTVDSNTQITCVSPAHAAGQVDITVVGPGGISTNTAADNYTYVAAPTVTSVTPPSGSMAGGTSVVIAGTNFTDATAVAFENDGIWTYPAADFDVDSALQITATTPAATPVTVDVRVTTIGGQSATNPGDHFTFIDSRSRGIGHALYGQMTPRRSRRQKGW